MNPIHDNEGNLIGVEMHQTRISAEAISQMAARIAALEAQLLEAQQANTRLIARIVELEHERDEARTLLKHYADMVARYARLTQSIAAPPRAATPGRLCDYCDKPLVSAHIADETIITDGTRRVSVHHVCMSAYPGWTVVATARGGRDA